MIEIDSLWRSFEIVSFERFRLTWFISYPLSILWWRQNQNRWLEMMVKIHLWWEDLIQLLNNLIQGLVFYLFERIEGVYIWMLCMAGQTNFFACLQTFDNYCRSWCKIIRKEIKRKCKHQTDKITIYSALLKDTKDRL